MSPHTRRSRLLAAAAALCTGLLTITACAESDPADPADPAAAESSDGGASSSAAGAQDLLVDYVGGTAQSADDSAQPVRIGFITQEGGIPSFPEAKVAAEAAVELVNSELGGVDGHPIELVPCVVVSSQEEALNCAQKMANDDTIQAVQLSLLTVGTDAIYSTLRGRKPVIGQTPASPTDVAVEDVYQPWPGSFGIQGGIAQYVADNLKAKNVAVVYDSDDPGSAFGAKTLAAAFDELGVHYTSVATLTGSADVSSALVSAGATSADAVVRVGSTPSCVPTAQAISQLGVTAPIVALDFCTDESVAKANGGDLPHWTYVGQARNVLAPENDDQVAAYRAAMKSYAPDAKFSGIAPYAWDSIIVDTKMLNEIGADHPSVDDVATWWRSFEGPLFLGPDKLDCGFLAKLHLPALCSTSVFFSSYDGDGQWQPDVAVDAQGLGIG